MKMKEFLLIMKNLIRDSLTLPLLPTSRLVFISDLHLGDGGKTDDFRHNEALLMASLREFYLPGGYTLVLNGDIEELHKFTLADIQKRYEKLYDIFRQFDQAGRLVKLVGNHDLGLLNNPDAGFKIHHALCLEHPQTKIMAFHGHQAYKLFMQYNFLSDFLVRNVVEPLKLANREKPLTSKRRYKAERRIYRASKELGLISINGHTHRPLFESYSKYDNLRWNLESLLRKYAGTADGERDQLESQIKLYAEEFKRLNKQERKSRVSRSLYEREEMLVPCMFNSGCATAKSGYTALELADDTIALAFWTKTGTARAYVEKDSAEQSTLADSPWKRYVLTRDSIEYIIARARLLA
ncbi:MAG: metallophosphoesterase [Spirochaetes bacterium]|nr:metallophosphoesterase [Spirochaetota bacterium]MBU0954694.1 metallophosphoesterase [Spirochaetota bacterium]